MNPNDILELIDSFEEGTDPQYILDEVVLFCLATKHQIKGE